jgi:hypothetical protein
LLIFIWGGEREGKGEQGGKGALVTKDNAYLFTVFKKTL